MDYLYDGTFEGLITCVYKHYYDEKATGIFMREHYQMSLVASFQEVMTDENKAFAVINAIEEKISTYAMACVYKTFLSSVENKEMKILKFIVHGFKVGPKVTLMHNNENVIPIHEAVLKVNKEQEKMEQLVRFSQLSNGIMYSQIEPDHNVIQLLAGHFCDRFKNEPFIIHDVGRDKALVAYQRNWYITDFNVQHMPELDKAQKNFEKLWKNYFEAIAIKERINPKCQRNFVPMRYRKYLTEFINL